MPASLLSPIPVEQWWDEPFLSLVPKRGVSKDRKTKRVEWERRIEEQEGRKGTICFLAEGDSAALVFSCWRNLQPGTSHTVSCSPKITTAMSLQKSSWMRKGDAGLGDKRPPQACRIILSTVYPAGNNSMCVCVCECAYIGIKTGGGVLVLVGFCGATPFSFTMYACKC